MLNVYLVTIHVAPPHRVGNHYEIYIDQWLIDQPLIACYIRGSCLRPRGSAPLMATHMACSTALLSHWLTGSGKWSFLSGRRDAISQSCHPFHTHLDFNKPTNKPLPSSPLLTQPSLLHHWWANTTVFTRPLAAPRLPLTPSPAVHCDPFRGRDQQGADKPCDWLQ